MGMYDYARTNMENSLERISEPNRTTARRVAQRLEAKGRKPTTVFNYVYNLEHADELLLGKPFEAATADDWAGVLAAFRRDHAASTVKLLASVIRCTLRQLYNEDLPEGISDVLTVRGVDVGANATVLTQADLQELLQAAADLAEAWPSYPRQEVDQALLWLLWDSGLRASEALSLDLGSIRLDDERGAWIALDASKPGLKTGAREIYVSECVGALRAWMDLHPAGPNARAPLFPSMKDPSGMARLGYQGLRNRLSRIVEASGIEARLPAGRSVSAHDFRHTCATRKARGGWNEAQLRAFFGWSGRSDMPSFYVHLALSDLRDQVRKDAGVDDLGYHQAVEVGDDSEALVALLQRLLAKDKAPARTRRTRERR